MKVLFVCLGNICRSPTAEAVMKHIIENDPKLSQVEIDSAGTGDWHVGNLPDERMRQHCQLRGYPMEMRARQFTKQDFQRFDLILTMDASNRSNVLKLAQNAEEEAKVKMMTDFCKAFDVDEVPDPYFGGADGFELVIDILEDSCAALASSLK